MTAIVEACDGVLGDGLQGDWPTDWAPVEVEGRTAASHLSRSASAERHWAASSVVADPSSQRGRDRGCDVHHGDPGRATRRIVHGAAGSDDRSGPVGVRCHGPRRARLAACPRILRYPDCHACARPCDPAGLLAWRRPSRTRAAMIPAIFMFAVRTRLEEVDDDSHRPRMTARAELSARVHKGRDHGG